VTIFAQHRLLDALHEPLDGIYRLAGAGWAVWFYLYKALVPINLMMIYPHWKDTLQSMGALAFVPTAAVAAVLALLVWKRRTGWGRPALMAFGYGVLAMVPVLGFMDMTFMMHALVADHFQYVPIVGILALAVVSGRWLIGRVVAERYRQPVSAGVVVMVLAGLAVLCVQRTLVLQNQKALWTDTTARNPHAWMAFFNLGNEYAQASFDRAEELYLRAIDLQPLFIRTYNNYGLSLVDQGRFAEGIEVYRRGIEIDRKWNPKNRSVRLLINLGVGYEVQGKLEEAAEAYMEALSLYARAGAENPGLRARLGVIQIRQGRLLEATTSIMQALKVSPNDPEARGALGMLMDRLGYSAEAVPCLERALEITPGWLQGSVRLIWIWSSHPDPSVRDAHRALELGDRLRQYTGDRDVRVLDAYAAALAEVGRFEEAAELADGAAAMARAAMDEALAAELAARGELYRNHRRYRRPA
jgi:tetratricopeptide (TPR) repeat protein